MKETYTLILRLKESKQVLIDLKFDNYVWAKSQFYATGEKIGNTIGCYDLYILDNSGKVIDEF